MTEPLVVITAGHGLEQPLSERIRTTRPILWMWVRRELRVRYRQSTLRASWGLIQPVAILISYGLVLTRVLDVGSDHVPYLTFAWAGIVPYTFVQQSLGQGVGSIQQSGALISRVYFPREILPLAIVGASLVDLGVMTVILVVLAWVQVGPPTIHLIALVPIYLVLLVWTTGLTMLAAAVTVFRRDLNHAMPLILRVLFIVTPVMYPAVLLRGMQHLSTLAVVIEDVRQVTFRGAWPDASVLGVHLALGLVVLAIGYTVLRRLEPRMGDFV